MKCFISHSYRTDISVIKKILEDRNISYVNPFDSLEPGSLIIQTLDRQMKESDFVIAVLDDNVNSAFEIGLAMGTKKPIFAISLDSKKKPFYLDFLMYTIAEPTDYDKINYSFEIFLKSLPKKKSSEVDKPPKTVKKFKGKRLDMKFANSIQNLNNVSGLEFEGIVANIFNQLNLEMLVQNKAKGKDFYADFSLWLDDLNSIIGNPIIIETKSNVNQRTLNNAIEQLTVLLSKFNSKVGLVIYNNPNNTNFELKVSYSPLVLCISIQDLINQLTEKTLSEIIIELRNSVAHKFKK